MRIRLIAILVLLFVVSPADARPLYEHERFCLATMTRIESSLKSHLPGDHGFVETHRSWLGKKFAHVTHIRDIWILRNGKVVIKVFLFSPPLPDDSLPSGAGISEAKLETKLFGEPVTYGIAVLGEDEKLVGEVLDIINKSLRPAIGAELQENVEINAGVPTGLLLLVTAATLAAGLIATVFVWRAKRIRSSLS